MHFLPDVYVPCDVCKGKRYNRETLEIRFKNKNIHEVLEMTVEEAREFFDAIPSISRKLQTLMDVGLSYIRLGQAATTLSGGEAQRVKLAKELGVDFAFPSTTVMIEQFPEKKSLEFNYNNDKKRIDDAINKVVSDFKQIVPYIRC